jgi:hypothetical protein
MNTLEKIEILEAELQKLKEDIKKIEILEAELQKLKEDIKKEETPKLELQLVVEDEQLFITLSSDWNDYIGYIIRRGECIILSTNTMVERYEAWREAGTHIKSEPVEWRGGKYVVSSEFGNIVLRRIDIELGGNIYDFDDCVYRMACKDDNIIRFKHNNRPIGF